MVKQNEHWQQLVVQGKFEEEKALAALACTSKALDNIFPTSIAQARNCGLPPISTVGKYRGKDAQQMLLQYVLTELNVAFGEKKALAPAALQMLGRQVLTKYFHWNLAEIRHAIQMGIQGSFAHYSEEELPAVITQDSKVFGSLDLPTVLRWFEGYDILKRQHAAQARQEEHAERMRNAEQFTDEGRALLLQALEKLKKAKLLSDTNGDTESDTGENEAGYKACLQYRTIEDYCQQEGEDTAEYLEALEKLWRAEYELEVKKSNRGIEKDVPFELYRQGKYQKHLLHLNNSRKVAI